MTRIIFNADDIGYSEAVTLGIIKAHQDGLIKTTTMMTNMPAASLAAKLLKENPNLYCGQHSNIVVGKPISNPHDIPSLVDENGKFNTKIRIARGEVLNPEDIRREVRAQAERFKELMGHYPSHIEGHAVRDPGLEWAVRKVAEELGVHYVDRSITILNGKPHIQYDLHKAGWEIPVDPDKPYYMDNVCIEYWLEDWGNLLSKDLVIMHTHPGYIDQDLLDWSSYNITRAKEVQIACDPRLKQWAKEHNVEFITFEDIKKI